MKTLKKTLCLVLAVVMVVGVLVIPANAADFKDQEKIEYDEAVAVLSGLGIINGVGNGDFRPEGTLTRAQAAKIIAAIDLGAEGAEKLSTTVTPFSDVAGHWAAKYIAYCANKGYVSGNADGRFAPEGELTGYAFAKMLLCALGYDPDTEGFQNVGAAWQANVESAARRYVDPTSHNATNPTVELDTGMDGLALGDLLTRDQAAQMAFNAITRADKVRYQGGTSIELPGGIVVKQGATLYTNGTFQTSLGLNLFGDDPLETTEDDSFGRPIAYQWQLKDGTPVYEKPVDAVKVYTDAASDVSGDLTKAKYTVKSDLKATENGTTGSTSAKDASEIQGLTGHSITVELYDTDDDKEIDKVVVIKPELAKVAEVKSGEITLGHGAGYATKDVKVESKADGSNADFYSALSSYAKDSYVIVVLKTGGTILSVEPANTLTGKLTKKSTNNVYTIDGKKYEESKAKMVSYTAEPGLSATEDVIVLTDANNYIMDFISATKATDNTVKAIYVTAKYNPVTEYGESDDTMFQGVLPDGTVVTGKVHAESTVAAGSLKAGAYTYEIADGAYKFTAASAEIPSAISEGGVYMVTKETDRESLPIKSGDKQMQVIKSGAKNFFSSDVKFVYISGSKAELDVDVKNGVQAVTLKFETGKNAEDFAVLTEDSNGNKLVTTVYVIGDVNTVDPVKGDKILYVVNKDKIGTALGDDGKEINVFEAYVDGEKIEFNCSDSDLTSKLGWNSYTIDSTTGGYSLEKLETGVAAEANYKDKIAFVNNIYYVTIEDELYDATDAQVVDVRGTKTTPDTEIASVADLLAANTNENLKIAVSYDKDAKTIDLIYVTADTQ